MTAFPGTRKPDFRLGRRMLTYDDYWEQRGYEARKKLSEREQIICDLVHKGERVLVVGCGTSRLPFALRENGAIVTVSDIARAAVEVFTKQGFKGFVLDLEQANDTRIEDDFDVIIASEVLEHIRNPELAIDALRKHTKRFVLSVPNSAFFRYRVHLMFGGRFFVQWAKHPAEHLRYWSHTDFLDWLAAMDLIVQRAIPANGLSCRGLCAFLKDLWPNLFAHQIIYDCTVRAKDL